MKKLKARKSNASFGIVTVNGIDIGIASLKGETFFSAIGIAKLEAKISGRKTQNIYTGIRVKAIRSGEKHTFHDGPIINGTRPTTFYLTPQFVYENANIGGYFAMLMVESGAKPSDVEMGPVLADSQVITAAEVDPKPVIERTDNGEDTVVFKGKNILQRLFGSLLRS